VGNTVEGKETLPNERKKLFTTAANSK